MPDSYDIDLRTIFHQNILFSFDRELFYGCQHRLHLKSTHVLSFLMPLLHRYWYMSFDNLFYFIFSQKVSEKGIMHRILTMNDTIHHYFYSRSSVNSTPVRGLHGMSPTSTPSPKKRQLPAIPVEAQRAGRDRGKHHSLFFQKQLRCPYCRVLTFSPLTRTHPMHGVQCRMISVDNFFVILRLLFFALLLLYVA